VEENSLARRPEGLGRIVEDMSCRAFVVVAFVKGFRPSAGQLHAKRGQKRE
jgi:hypothetical protein